MAFEIFNVGSRDFRLPGLGWYLQTAANEGNLRAVILGVATLVVVIGLLDQFVWRPLIAWTDKFKVDMVEDDEPPRSWLLDLISRLDCKAIWRAHLAAILANGSIEGFSAARAASLLRLNRPARRRLIAWRWPS